MVPQLWLDACCMMIKGRVNSTLCVVCCTMLGDVRGDWLLKFLYRTASVQMRVAGLQAIDWRDRRMQNVDLTDVVSKQTKNHWNKSNSIRSPVTWQIWCMSVTN